MGRALTVWTSEVHVRDVLHSHHVNPVQCNQVECCFVFNEMNQDIINVSRDLVTKKNLKASGIDFIAISYIECDLRN